MDVQTRRSKPVAPAAFANSGAGRRGNALSGVRTHILMHPPRSVDHIYRRLVARMCACATCAINSGDGQRAAAAPGSHFSATAWIRVGTFTINDSYGVCSAVGTLNARFGTFSGPGRCGWVSTGLLRRYVNRESHRRARGHSAAAPSGSGLNAPVGLHLTPRRVNWAMPMGQRCHLGAEV